MGDAMIDPTVLGVLIGSGTTLIIAACSGLRWWIDRRDAQIKAKAEKATREVSETEAAKTIRTLTRQKQELEAANDDLRRELRETTLELADCYGGRRSPEVSR